MPKRISIRALIFYLRRVLETEPGSRARLDAQFEKHMGKPLERRALWRHLTLRIEPSADVLIVYLTFLHREGAIVLGQKPKDPLYVYARPGLLRAGK